jgi:hypothetical protein
MSDVDFMSVAHRSELLRQLFGGGRPCCDHCNNREGDPDGHDYGDESAHDGPCADCLTAEQVIAGLRASGWTDEDIAAIPLLGGGQ